MTARLSVLCWDDPRCILPLERALAVFTDANPGISVRLVCRELSDFNDEPIEAAVRRADVIVLDYPMIPRAAEAGLVRDLSAVAAPPSVSAEIDASFLWRGTRWGVPVDAACHVAAWRPDRLDRPPRTWDEVRRLAAGSPGEVAIPTFHSDLVCALLSITASVGGLSARHFDIRHDAVELLFELVGRLDSRLWGLNPPQLLTALQGDTRASYVPLTFGYSRLTMESRPVLRWADAPALGGRIGSVLGGAGMAVSAASADPELAERFVEWYASGAVQHRIVPGAGGQPAVSSAWADPEIDARAGGFYGDTLATMRAAVRRPALPQWPAFSLAAGLMLSAALTDGTPAATAVDRLRALATDRSIPFEKQNGNDDDD